MLLSNNEYLTYRVSYWKKLKLRIVKELKRPKVILSLGSFLAIVISFKLGVFNSYINSCLEDFYNITVKNGLKLENVYLEGQVNLKNTQVLKSLENEVGSPILKVSVWGIKEKLEEIGWVLSANVARELPNTIHIRIVERTPIAIWQNNQKQFLIDDTGHVIQEAEIAKFGNLPVVVGEGSRVNASDLISILKNYPKLLSRVVAAIRIGDRRWNIRIKNGPEIKLPEKNIDNSIKTLIEYDKKSQLLGSHIEAVDMRVQGKIFYKKK